MTVFTDSSQPWDGKYSNLLRTKLKQGKYNWVMGDTSKERALLTRKVDSASVLACVNREYGWVAQDVIQLPGGTEKVAWLVTTLNGKWVTKIFSEREGSVSRIQEENKLYKFLNAHGIHAPEILGNQTGQDVSLLPFEGVNLSVVVMKFEELRIVMPINMTRDEMTKIAIETAKMHKALLEYSREETQTKDKNLDIPRAYDALVESVHAKSFSSDQLDQYKDIDTRMGRYIQTHLQPERLTKTLIHGDLAPEHARFLPDGGVYFFDFSDRSWAPVALELGIYFDALHSWGDVPVAKWEQLNDWFLESYQSVFPLTELDLQAIPLFMLYRQMDVIKYLCKLYKNEPNEHTVNWVKRGYNLGEHLLDKLK